MKKIDACGLDCPEPVIKAKQALEEVDRVEIKVDNQVAADNLAKLARKLDASATRLEGEGEYTLTIESSGEVETGEQKSDLEDSNSKKVYLITSQELGEGAVELGAILLRGFLNTLLNVDPKPAKIIFINSGVKIPTEKPKAQNHLQQLEKEGVSILVCGTCLDYYQLESELEVGEISNMYEIVETLNNYPVVKL